VIVRHFIGMDVPMVVLVVMAMIMRGFGHAVSFYSAIYIAPEGSGA
jgi:Na+-transporting methylmalonyl-CoA/oxaloacetate decarboxylase gamma subunit